MEGATLVVSPALQNTERHAFFALQIGVRFAREEDTVPYMVSQPLPWQVHSVSHSRKSSKAEEVSAHAVHIPPVPEGSLIIMDALDSD